MSLTRRFDCMNHFARLLVLIISPLPFTNNSIGEESHLAIETSGHGDLKENDWLDDGAYLMVRVSGFGGWFLLRLSLHDPVLPLNIEAPSHEDAVKLGLEVAAAVKEFQALDTSALDKFVQP
ncbi:hypothetical protein GOBAR_DD21110 [Gossypium barbadense]|nr:hypothetical protein GOBAR_DD21110 [Gossypium barbadense]